MKRPLVTFALVSYNHERFVGEAIRGALAQTYSPLQVVISDDCSQDRTFEVIQEEVDGYDGPHQILLNRNERNLGYMGHMNRVMELAEGELIVHADADDVSLPTRTEELVRAWSEADAFGVYSNYDLVDEEGVEEQGAIREARMQHAQEPPKSWEEMVQSGRTGITGCALAWDRAVFDTFGPLPDKAMFDDVPIPFRAVLLGKGAYVDKPLVRYRRHDGNMAALVFHQSRGESLAQFMNREGAMARVFGNHYESWLRDMVLLSSSDPKMKDRLSQAMRITAARIGFYRFKESATQIGTLDRLYRFLRIVKSAKALGIKSVLKLFLMTTSPTAYYRVQRFKDKRPSELLTDPSSEADPLRVIGPK
jgi:glycosyltransferase involved in cell wall biosynthesis